MWQIEEGSVNFARVKRRVVRVQLRSVNVNVHLANNGSRYSIRKGRKMAFRVELHFECGGVVDLLVLVVIGRLVKYI